LKDIWIGSIECFVQQGSATLQPFQTYTEKGREFSNLLVQMSMEIFGLDCSVIHLYWDERGTSRAFNRGGSLFFNLNCWVVDNDSMKSNQTWKRWFGTFCHELSHNLHAQHDASFANFLELFCVEFSDRFLNAMKIRGLTAA
jgi:WLM domain